MQSIYIYKYDKLECIQKEAKNKKEASHLWLLLYTIKI